VLLHAVEPRPRGVKRYRDAKDKLCVRLVATVREQLLVELEDRPPCGLEELNGTFQAWAESVYHRRVHSETGQAPLKRFLAAGAPTLPSERSLREAFRWSERRTVSRTGTFEMHGNTYEVDPGLAGRRVELIFDPLELADVEVRLDGHHAGMAVPLRIKRHVHPRAQAQPEPGAPTGIDYLGLIRKRRERELQKRIDYRHLPGPDGAGNTNDEDRKENAE
jgi:putative transposase